MKSYPVIINRKIRIAIVGCGRISKNHFDKAYHNINLLHDLVHDFILSSQLKLVLFQHIVKLQNVIIESTHLLFDYDVKLSHADLLDNF